MKIYDVYSKYHGKIKLEKIVPKFHPLFPIEGKHDSFRLSRPHVRKQDFRTLNLFTGKMEKREQPLPPEFKTILELSCRAPYCPVPFTLDTMMGVCAYNCIYCVDGNTKILLAGKRPRLKKIRYIKPGDKVLGYDTKLGMLRVNVVKKVMRRLEENGYLIIDIGLATLKITPEHPVYTKEGWKSAGELKVGDYVLFVDDPHLRACYRMSERMKEHNPMKDPEVVKKVISGRDNSILSRRLKERWEKDEAYQEIVRRAMKERNPMRNPYVAAKMGLTRSERIKAGLIDMSKQHKFFKENLDILIKKGLAASAKTGKVKLPTKPERKLIAFFDRENLPFRYVGDGRFWVGNKNPDFVDTITGNHLIEFVGDTIHRNVNKYLRERKEYFEERGYRVLFLYYEDLENLPALKDKVMSFLSNPVTKWVKVISIKKVNKPKIVYNIETSNTNNYFAEGILVHNCFTALTVSSLMTAFFDSDKPLAPRYASPEYVKKYLDEVLTAKGVEPYERYSGSNVCGSTNDTRALKKAAAQRIPLRFGTRSENFLPREKEVGAALTALKVVKDHEYPLIINTKSDLLLEEPYFSAITEIKNVAIQVTITHNDDSVAKRLEPGAPPSSRRWEVLKTFNEVGINAMPRMEPAAAFINDDDEHLEAYFTKAAECGCKKFMGDAYHHTVKATQGGLILTVCGKLPQSTKY